MNEVRKPQIYGRTFGGRFGWASRPSSETGRPASDETRTLPLTVRAQLETDTTRFDLPRQTPTTRPAQRPSSERVVGSADRTVVLRNAPTVELPIVHRRPR